MAKLTNLNLNEFSIVRGDDVQPANPGAVALVYKAQPKPKEKDEMAKENFKGTAPINKKSRAEAIVKAVKDVLKGTWTENSSYSSQSSTVVTTVEDPADPDGGGDPTVIVIQDSVEKTDPAPAVAPAPAADSADVIAKAVEKALAPVQDAITKFDSRLAKVEGQSTGSRQIGKGIPTGGTMIESTDRTGYGAFNEFLKNHYGLTGGQKLTKATLSSAGWSYGLSFVEAGQFIDYVVDQSAVLKQCRTVKMKNVKEVIDIIGITGNVLVKGTPGTDPGDTVTVSTPTQVALTAQEVIAIVSIGDDTLEDNIEGEELIQHILGMVGRTAANQLEGAAMMGDTGNADSGILDRWDGWNKLARNNGAHVIEGMADGDRKWPGTNPNVGWKMTKLLKAIPSKYRSDPAMLRAILNFDLYLDYQDALSTLAYTNAFPAVTGQTDLPIRGINNLRMPLLPTNISFTYSSVNHTDGTFVMLTNLQNLIFGIHRDIKIEPFRQPRKRCTDYVISMRAVPQIQNGDAIGIYDHLQLQ